MKTTKARLEEGFTSGFLILGLVIFIAGFLMGMLAIALIPAKADYTVLGLLLFSFGFVLGMVVIALMWVVVRLNEFAKKSS